MSRAIDADALIYHLADYQLQESPGWGANGCGNADAYEAITNCIKAIEDAPTIEPERKKGKWVNCYTDGFRNMCKCSGCGARIDIQEKFRSFFCYHCGADMRERRTDETD